MRIIMPGRVFNEPSVHVRLHVPQIEGLYIDKGVSFADSSRPCFDSRRSSLVLTPRSSSPFVFLHGAQC